MTDLPAHLKEPGYEHFQALNRPGVNVSGMEFHDGRDWVPCRSGSLACDFADLCWFRRKAPGPCSQAVPGWTPKVDLTSGIHRLPGGRLFVDGVEYVPAKANPPQHTLDMDAFHDWADDVGVKRPERIHCYNSWVAALAWIRKEAWPLFDHCRSTPATECGDKVEQLARLLKP